MQQDFRVHQTDDESREAAADDEDEGEDDDASDKTSAAIARIKPDTDAVTDSNLDRSVAKRRASLEEADETSQAFAVDVSDLETCKFLQISQLTEWDYSIFEASSVHKNCILSKVSGKL